MASNKLGEYDMGKLAADHTPHVVITSRKITRIRLGVMTCLLWLAGRLGPCEFIEIHYFEHGHKAIIQGIKECYEDKFPYSNPDIQDIRVLLEMVGAFDDEDEE